MGLNIRAKMLCALLQIFLLPVLLPPAALAQDRVTVPWAPISGLYEERADGSLSGFLAEMAREVARRANLEIDWLRTGSHPDTLAALARGQGEMLAGVVRLPVLDGRAIYSEPFAESAAYLFVRSEEPADIGPDDMRGRTIGYLRNAEGAEQAAPLSDRTQAYESLGGLFGSLLVGEVDGVVVIHKVSADYLQRARLETRLRTAGPPLRTYRHYVALAPERAGLMPRINAALEDMREDGTLMRILHRWNMVPPEPVPDVLTVGVANFPPYQVVGSDGSFSGFGVETLRDLAGRAGLKLKMKEISSEEWAAGPEAGKYDLLPPISVTQEKAQRMDFTRPLQRSPYAIFMRAGDPRRFETLTDLSGVRVGVIDRNLAASVAREKGLAVTPFETPEAMVRGLLADEIDAFLYASFTTRQLLEQMDVAGSVREAAQPFVNSDRAIALRVGLPAVRDRLDSIIPGYLSSEAYLAVRDRWFGTSGFWTPERIRMAVGTALALTALVALAFLVQARRGQRRALDQAARLSQVTRRLRAVLDTTRAAILGMRADGSIGIANPGAVRMLGLPGETSPTPWPADVAFIDPDSRVPLEHSADPLRRAMAGETIISERAVLTRGGNERYVRLSSSSVPEKEDTEVSTVIVIEDVTEQERVRQQAERAGRLDALGQLTGGVAHDFNNILATIHYAAHFLRTTVDDKQRKYVETTLASVTRGEELTSRLLAFAKRRPTNTEAVSLAVVLKDLESLARPVIERSIGLTMEPLPEPLHVDCDLGQLENALLNLLLNSRDAILGASDSGTVTVACRRLDEADIDGRGRIEIVVADDGPGMNEEVRRRALDPFFTTKDADKGTGLGLSMVYGFVEQSGGTLVIDSEPGQGTAIRIVLRESPAPDGDAFADSGQIVDGNGETILLVEDEPDLLNMTAEIVTGLGYKVLTAASGRKALELVQRDGICFDLLLTDVVMPEGIGGFELARRLRVRSPELPIVYMSGYTGLSREGMGDAVGLLVSKPCTTVALSRVIRQGLDGSPR